MAQPENLFFSIRPIRFQVFRNDGPINVRYIPFGITSRRPLAPVFRSVLVAPLAFRRLSSGALSELRHGFWPGRDVITAQTFGPNA